DQVASDPDARPGGRSRGGGGRPERLAAPRPADQGRRRGPRPRPPRLGPRHGPGGAGSAAPGGRDPPHRRPGGPRPAGPRRRPGGPGDRGGRGHRRAGSRAVRTPDRPRT
ncbi:MAG: bll7613; hypothetical protein, partial [uncultured Acetobacteraceae bacterium]